MALAIEKTVSLSESIKEALRKKGVRAYIEIEQSSIQPIEYTIAIEIDRPDEKEYNIAKELAKKLIDKGLEVYPEYTEYVQMFYVYDLVTGEKVNEEVADWEIPYDTIRIEVRTNKDEIEKTIKEILEAIEEIE